MAIVFQAHHPQLDRLVALKVLLPILAFGPSSHERFLRDARAAAGLDHDHIVQIYQVGEDRGVPYLANHGVREDQAANGGLCALPVLAPKRGNRKSVAYNPCREFPRWPGSLTGLEKRRHIVGACHDPNSYECGYW
jgi:hypothetical protein